MTAIVGDIVRAEHGTLMSLQGGCPVGEDDDRNVLLTLHEDLYTFNELARPYLSLRTSEGAAYEARLVFSIDVEQHVQRVPEIKEGADAPARYTKVLDHSIRVLVEAEVHPRSCRERKVLSFRGAYEIRSVVELADIILRLANNKFHPKGGSE